MTSLTQLGTKAWGCVDRSHHHAVEEEASLNAQQGGKGKAASITEKWRHVLIILEAHSLCFLHFLTVCYDKLSFSDGWFQCHPIHHLMPVNMRIFLMWSSNDFFSYTYCSKSCWISDSYWLCNILYSICLPWSFWLLWFFFLWRWYIHICHHIPNNFISYSFCIYLKCFLFPCIYFNWSQWTTDLMPCLICQIFKSLNSWFSGNLFPLWKSNICSFLALILPRLSVLPFYKEINK